MKEKKSQNCKSKNARYLIVLIVNTILFFVIYRVPLSYAELTDQTLAAFVTMLLYFALLLGFGLAYLIYNRFFYRKGILPEQLPDDWSAEQKCSFVEDGERRLQRSKWMLTIIFPLLFTFLFDTFDLFIIDRFFRH